MGTANLQDTIDLEYSLVAFGIQVVVEDNLVVEGSLVVEGILVPGGNQVTGDSQAIEGNQVVKGSQVADSLEGTALDRLAIVVDRLGDTASIELQRLGGKPEPRGRQGSQVVVEGNQVDTNLAVVELSQLLAIEPSTEIHGQLNLRGEQIWFRYY